VIANRKSGEESARIVADASLRRTSSLDVESINEHSRTSRYNRQVKAMNMMKILPAFALMAGLVPAGATVAQAAIRTGTLTCDVAAGQGMVVTSRKAVSCRFTRLDGRTESYIGDIRKLGIDVGFTRGSRIIWQVFEPAANRGALAGRYTGASAEATLAAGLGANVLVGGGNGGVTLQPVSVQGQTGLNLAAGVGALNIQRAEAPKVILRHHKRVQHKAE
jgi:hypothetical protein